MHEIMSGDEQFQQKWKWERHMGVMGRDDVKRLQQDGTTVDANGKGISYDYDTTNLIPVSLFHLWR